MIKKKIGYLIRKIQKDVLWKYKQLKNLDDVSDRNDDIFEMYKKFADLNKDVVYSINYLKMSHQHGLYKWVGAQQLENTIVGVPNDANSILRIDAEGVNFFENLKEQTFKWTGGFKKDDILYCFPRSSNTVLIYDNKEKIVREVDLKTPYVGEHHYGGVMVGEIAIQPPRNTDHFLLWNVNTFTTKKIQISPRWMKMQFRYSSSIVHPCGYIFFIPENEGKVIKMNVQTLEWGFIGKPIYSTVFDVKVSSNGNIYGFASTVNGMIKIDVEKDEVSMIHTDKFIGAYGTKIGINGYFYSIPGNGSRIWKFNPETEELIEMEYEFDDRSGKFAGGVTCENGTIIGMPSKADMIIRYIPSVVEVTIPRRLFDEIYSDNY